MVPLIWRCLDALSGDKPFSCRRIIPRVGLRLFYEIAVSGRHDVAGINWVAIFIAAALKMKNRVGFAGVPIMGVCIKGQNKPYQGYNKPLRMFHGRTPQHTHISH
jgi:hypothetical protein